MRTDNTATLVPLEDFSLADKAYMALHDAILHLKLEPGEPLVEQKLAAALGIRWPHNALRHSYISYRLALVKSADQVALEAGNSPAMIFKHYRELTTEEIAQEWFSLFPKDSVQA